MNVQFVASLCLQVTLLGSCPVVTVSGMRLASTSGCRSMALAHCAERPLKSLGGRKAVSRKPAI